MQPTGRPWSGHILIVRLALCPARGGWKLSELPLMAFQGEVPARGGWERGGLWGHTGSLAGSAAPRAWGSSTNLPACWGPEGMPFIKIPKSCRLCLMEGRVRGCHGYKLPENIVVCILLECLWKIRKGSLKGKEIKYKERPRKKYVVKRFYLNLFYLLKKLTCYNCRFNDTPHHLKSQNAFQS